MKNLVWYFFLFPFFLIAQPEQAKIIAPIAQVQMDNEYYSQQSKVWEQVVKEDPSNAQAWFNYYKAARYSLLTKKSRVEGQTFASLEPLIAEMKKAIPNTFEFHYAAYENSNQSEDKYHHLEKAYRLDTGRYETYESFVTYHEIHGNPQNKKIFCKKIYDAGVYNNDIYSWNYNVLIALEKNALLMSMADIDSYPAWVLQKIKGVRSDVKVVNLFTLQKHKYREKIFQEIEIPPYPNNSDSASIVDIAKHLTKHSKRPLYFGAALYKNVKEELAKNLFLTGLSYKYSKNDFDNVADLRNSFENKWMTDYLNLSFNSGMSQSVVEKLNLYYIQAFLILHDHYLISGEKSKAKELEILSKKIATSAGYAAKINQRFEDTEEEEEVPVKATLELKGFERSIKKIKGNTFAANTEVTNGQYETFMISLLKEKKYKELEAFKSAKTDWNEEYKYYFSKKHDAPMLVANHGFENMKDSQAIAELFPNAHPDKENAPVQNITHEAAVAYCDWLTDWYHSIPQKKRKYNKVQFYLPTNEEWEYAARGDNTEYEYPWGYNPRNKKGCFLANFYVYSDDNIIRSKEKHCSMDGGFFSVFADAYFPNDFGLYGVSGNVAEMIAEEGIAKGGSWADAPENCKVFSKRKYDKPHPSIGFRVFMKVLVP